MVFIIKHEKVSEVWLYLYFVCSVTDLGFKKYKFMVQVVLGERHGAGVKIGSRCIWDADTDNYASDVFMNVSNYVQGVSEIRL